MYNIYKASVSPGSVQQIMPTPSHKNVTTIWGKLCFLCGLRQENAWNNRLYVIRQRRCKHASLTKEDGVFREVRAEELSLRQSALQDQFSVDSHGKFVVEEELEVGL
jgi:hypothetical protein